ncbi:deoxyguanosinetriphosphate triphosphohydrolase [Candidatus Tenderia electrophaga]|jgi:dGTPase|uniref:Deoxyguanosinetriphosphate triphosphohydrolase-like protein n=1 Tax=Candidatus Tenderia electrophaga TaxID=1748243 RepID=A0A0S2TGJ1_9GAMM|nr:deoxyguanosinetriphosphate triphosphohydrolase [Candidatus Tenderia electrophaga]
MHQPQTNLAVYAAHPSHSRGRMFDEAGPQFRSDYQRDRDRIVHSSAFRRLEYKTQVFVNHEGDMFRTRLTHSIEVAQIGRSIARALQLNEDLTEAIALAHDLGHTPFGHAGQDVLNACMRDYGGFEHNLQSLRVVDELEEKYAEFRGLNLTFETREGILKHCNLEKAKRLAELGQRFLHKTQPGLEAQLANLADEIAYNNHDVDDGLRAGLITVEQLCEIALFRRQYDEVKRRYPDITGRRMVHEIIRRMINDQVSDLINHSQDNLRTHRPESIDAVRALPQAMICFSAEMDELNLQLKQFLRRQLYHHYRVQRMANKAGRVIRNLFNAFMDETAMLPPEQSRQCRQLEAEQDEQGRARVVADYIAGMTDRYAIIEHDRIFDPSALT